MKLAFEFHVLPVDQMQLGFSLDYGVDDMGKFHQLGIGLLLFSVCFMRYLEDDKA